VCGMESQVFSILDSEESCAIVYNWSSTDSADGSNTGSGSKTLVLKVDDAVLFTETVETSGRTLSCDVPVQSHGAHRVEAWMEKETDGIVTTTAPLRHIGVWLEEGNDTCIVGVLIPEIHAKQYATVPVKYFAVVPGSETAQVELMVDGESAAVLNSVGRSVQTWA